MGSNGEGCKTAYPILLVHGVGVPPRIESQAWSLVKSALEGQGARVFLGSQDAWGCIEANAAQLAEKIDSILVEAGVEKVNIIAHSKGGLDARYLASSYDGGAYARRIASITTVSTPHHGSKTMQALLKLPGPLFSALALPVNAFYRHMGDARPDFKAVCAQLQAGSFVGEGRFNAANPDVAGILYSHYAAVLTGPFDSLGSLFSYLVIRAFEGPNDDLVALSSAVYGGSDFKGVLLRPDGRGIAHPAIAGMKLRRWRSRRQPIERQGSYQGLPVIEVPSVRSFFCDLAAQLKAAGL
jgi:triacylglycerol lipase